MKRYYYIGTDLDDLGAVERELERVGISTPQIHILSNDDDAIGRAHLNDVEAVLRRDVIQGTERGAVFGALCAAAVLLLFWLSGLTTTYTWIPAIFLAVVILGFCTWEGGLIGIQEPHWDFGRFQRQLDRGKHVLLVDLEPGQEFILKQIATKYPGLRPAGTGRAAPGWVIAFRRRWERFMELAP